MSLEVDPDFATHRPLLHLPGRLHGRRRPRRPGHRLALDDAAPHGHPRQGRCSTGFPTHARAPRRLPAAGHCATARCSSAPATPRSAPTRANLRLARRQDAPPRPAHRRAVAGQPVRGGRDRNKRYVHTYGHRNVQGLGQRRDGTLWSVEQGTYRDDEVNLLAQRRRLRLQPGPRLQREGADDRPVAARHAAHGALALRQPDDRHVRRRLGRTASSGARSTARFAVGRLKAQRVVFLTLRRRGHAAVGPRTPARCASYGRLRSVTQAADGDLLVTTDNGGGNDAILRVSPALSQAPRLRRRAEQAPTGQRTRTSTRAATHRDAPAPTRGCGVHQRRGDDRAAPPRRAAAARRPTRARQPAGGVQEERARHPGHADERPRRGGVAVAAGADACQGTSSSRLVVVPLRVVVPLLVALLGLLQRALGLRARGVGPEPVDGRAAVLPSDGVCFTQYQY